MKFVKNEDVHQDVITDLQCGNDRTYFLTTSKDKTAKVRFIYSLILNTFM